METILLFTFILNSLLWVSRKSKGENNFFEVISITLATVILWVLIPYPAAKVYIIASATALVWVRSRFGDNSQIIVNLYKQRLRNNNEYRYLGSREMKKVRKLSDCIHCIKLTILFAISLELLIYSYQIALCSSWWMWLILAPVCLICICIVVLLIKEFFDRL